MASIRKKKTSVYWFACFYLPTGQRAQRSTKTTDKRLAQKLAEQFESAGRAHITALQARRIISEIHAQVTGSQLAHLTVEQYMTQWCSAKKGSVSSSTHTAYSAASSSWCRFLGKRAGVELIQITPSDITAFRNSAAEESSPSTANLRLKIIRTALQQAWREGLIPENPASKVQILKVKKHDVSRRGFSLNELKSLLGYVSGEWKGLVLFGVYTGQRLGDLARLQWRNVNLDEGTVTLTTVKTERRQILPLSVPLLEWLKRGAEAETKTGHSPIFPCAFKTTDVQGRVGTLSNQFRKILADCGLVPPRSHLRTKEGRGRSGQRKISELSFHSLRHTATSMMKSAGISPALVQEFIGHDSKVVSQNYTHIDIQALRLALGGLPRLG